MLTHVTDECHEVKNCFVRSLFLTGTYDSSALYLGISSVCLDRSGPILSSTFAILSSPFAINRAMGSSNTGRTLLGVYYVN